VITTVEKVLFLKSIDLFRGLPGEELAQIAEIAEEVPVDAEGHVFSEGDPGDSLYIVVEGKVRVFRGERPSPNWASAPSSARWRCWTPSPVPPRWPRSPRRCS